MSKKSTSQPSMVRLSCKRITAARLNTATNSKGSRFGRGDSKKGIRGRKLIHEVGSKKLNHDVGAPHRFAKRVALRPSDVSNAGTLVDIPNPRSSAPRGPPLKT
jgi:hypothetical protein